MVADTPVLIPVEATAFPLLRLVSLSLLVVVKLLETVSTLTDTRPFLTARVSRTAPFTVTTVGLCFDCGTNTLPIITVINNKSHSQNVGVESLC